MLPYEKTLLVTNIRLEAKDLVVLEMLDEAGSVPPNFVKTHVARISLSEFQSLGLTLGGKAKVTITFVPNA